MKKNLGKCSAYECHTGYDRNKKVEDKTKEVDQFNFPLKKPKLLEKWENIFNMKKDPGNLAVHGEKRCQRLLY